MTTKAQRINHIAKLIKKATTVTGSRACIKSLANQVQAAIDAETLEQYSELVTRVNPSETYTELTERVTPTETYTELKARILGQADATTFQLSSVSTLADQLTTETNLETIGTLVSGIKTAADSTDVEKVGQLSFNEKDGMPFIHLNSVQLVRGVWTFWAENFSFQGESVVTERLGDNEYAFTCTVAGLDLVLEGEMRIDGQDVIWSWTQTATEAHPVITGAVVQFNFDIASEPDAYMEEDLDGNGFTIKGLDACGDIHIAFQSIAYTLNADRSIGYPTDNLRATFLGTSIEVGVTTNGFTITLPEEIEVVPSLEERLGTPETWLTGVLNHTTTPVDLSFLQDAPAGKHGRLSAVDDRLVFADETEVKFWGCNVQAYALFSASDANIILHAERISKLGYNLVRLHHHDSGWVQPNVFGLNPDDSLSLNATYMAKLCLWIYELKSHGIYIWLDLQVERPFKAADGIDNFTEISKGNSSSTLKGYNYLDEDVQALQIAFNDAYLNYTNPLTELKFKDDPAIINAMLINENDLVSHFGNGFLANQSVPNANAVFEGLAEDFATEYSYNPDDVKATWIPGPSKIFMGQLEHDYNQIMIAGLTTSGYSGMVSTTNTWGGNPLYCLPSLTDGDLIDVHTYGGPGTLDANPRFKSNLSHWIGMAQVYKKPLAITEWNIERFALTYPYSYDRIISPVYIAALCSFQSWRLPFMYGYAQQSLSSAGTPDTYSAYNDPAQMALQPAAALLHRQDHVSPAVNTFALSLTANEFYSNTIRPTTSSSIRTIQSKSRLVIDIPETTELSWLSPATLDEGITLITTLDYDFIGEADEVTSDTGELTHNFRNKDYKINTDKSQIIMGWLGGRTITMPNVVSMMNNPFCAVSVQAFDNVELNTSDEIFITIATITDSISGVYSTEPLDGTVKVKAKSGLTLYQRSNSGVETEHSSSYEDGWYTFTVDENVNTFWFMLHAA